MILYTLSLIGVAVFAASGALEAGRKGFDLIGVSVIAVVTALGGGTVRDILLARGPVFWVQDPAYLWVSCIGAWFTFIAARFIRLPALSLVIADGLGLAFFTISGAQIAEQQQISGIIVVLMGTLTGVAGGVLRDTLSGEIPLLFRPTETLYATTAILGATGYLVLQRAGVEHTASALWGMGMVAALRFAAIIWGIRLPAFPVQEGGERSR